MNKKNVSAYTCSPYLSTLKRLHNTFCIVLFFHDLVFFFLLTMNEIVWPEKTPDATSSYTVHRTRLQVNKHSPGDIFTTCMHTGWIPESQNLFLEFYFTSYFTFTFFFTKCFNEQFSIFFTMCLIEVDVKPLQ